MESKLEILILALFFSCLFIIFSGNDKTSLGKKVKVIGFQLLSSASILLGAIYVSSDLPLARDILFYTGILMCVGSTFQLGKVIKQLAATSA